jgi:hypothetical protein
MRSVLLILTTLFICFSLLSQEEVLPIWTTEAEKALVPAYKASLLEKEISLGRITLHTALIYFLYLLSTKTDLQFNLILIGFMFMCYLYNLNIDKINNRIDNDPDLSPSDKLLLQNKNKLYEYYIVIITGTIIGILAYIYGRRKKIQYGGGFNYIKFMLY